MAAGFAVIAFIAAASTIPQYGITWDEPSYVSKTRQVRDWFSLLVAEPGKSVSEEAIEEHWPVWKSGQSDNPWDSSMYDMSHPPFVLVMGGLIAEIFEGTVYSFTAHRLLGALSYSFIVCLLFLWVGRLEGRFAGAIAAMSFALLPRIFGHAHFFATDMPSAALIFLSIFLFATKDISWRRSFAAGIILGFALSSKFTAILAPTPVILWVLMNRNWKSLPRIGAACLIALGVAWLVDPGLWHHPIDQVKLFFKLSTQRARYVAIPTYYFGKVYWFNLPWHHPLVMIFGSMPAVTPLFMLGGAVRSIKRHFRDDGFVILLSAPVFIAAFIMPGAPGHDGIRLFMPVFPFIAALTGFGFILIVERIKNKKVTAALAALALIPGLVGIIRWHPYELSYYGGLLGGARGAHKLGMESTYWFDVLNPENEASVVKATEGAPRTFKLSLLPILWRIETGRLGPDATATTDNPYWLLAIARQGMLSDIQRLIMEYGSPRWELRVDGIRLAALFEYSRRFDGILEELTNSDKDAPEKLYLMGLYWEGKENSGKALQFINDALKLRPGMDRAELHKARVLRDMGWFEEAATIFYRRAHADPTGENWIELARTYAVLGMFGQALDAYEKVLQIHFNYPHAKEEYQIVKSLAPQH